MEGLSVSKVFGVPEDYTLEELKKSYIDIIENLLKSDRTQVEKDLLTDQYKKLYHRGKQMYLERVSMETDVEYPSNYVSNYPYYSSYGSISYDNSHSNELDLFDKFDRMFDGNYGLSERMRRRYNPFSMFDNIYSQMDKQINQNMNQNSNTKVYSYSSSYSSKTNPDGSTTFVEKKSESTNGDKKKTINAWKKMPDGKIVNLSDDEMKEITKMSSRQIEN